MLTIAHTTPSAHALQIFERAFPEAEFLLVAPDQLERVMAEQSINALVVTGHALAENDVPRLAVLKARHPSLMILAYLPAAPELGQQLQSLRLSYADGLIIEGFDDHPARLRELFASAAAGSIAYAFERASSPSPPLLVARNVEPAIRDTAGITAPAGFASALGAPLGRLRAELHASRLFSPKTSLAWLRLACAGRRLGDTEETVEEVSLGVGYASAVVLRNACRDLLHTKPHEVRAGGGLGFVTERYRSAVAEWRAKPAA